MKLSKPSINQLQQTNQTTQTASTNQTAQTGNIGQIGDLPTPPIGQLPTPVICPKPIDGSLSESDLARVAGVGGQGLRGTGTLKGEVALQKRGKVEFGIATLYEVPVLITANKGNSSEVTFELDITPAQARALEGTTVEIQGTIDKDSPYTGSISGATIGKQHGVKAGSWQQLGGKIENRQLFGPGGEAPPSGSYLVLHEPIIVDGQEVKELFVGKELKDGSEAKLSGRIDVGSFGGVEVPPTNYLQLTGVSDLIAGEPAFDGKVFTDNKGKELEVLSWYPPEVADIPSTIFVLDQGHDKAWVGRSGGFIPPWMNGFHGFRESRAISNPTAADRAAVQFDANNDPISAATGKKLDLVSIDEPPPGMADGLTDAWYYNRDTDAMYRLQTGGIAGFNHHMTQVVRPNSEE